jgi:heptosyltransferase-3
MVHHINHLRRRFMTFFTNQLIEQPIGEHINNTQSVKRILICRPNQRLGNLLMLTPLLQELEHVFPDARIDLVVKGGLAKALFEGYTHVRHIYQFPQRPFKSPIEFFKTYFQIRSQAYDIAINPVDGSNSATLLIKKIKAKHKSFGELASVYWGDQHQARHMAIKPVLALRYLTRQGRVRKIPTLNIRLTANELAAGKRMINEHCQPGKKIIALFTFATGSKMHSKAWWHQFHTSLQLKFPQANIIEILPLEKSSQLDFKANTIYSKNVRELAAILAACDVFVGADSGVMHLASAVNTPTLGLFKTTDHSVYRPYNELSQAIITPETRTKELLNHLGLILEQTSELSGTVDSAA